MMPISPTSLSNLRSAYFAFVIGLVSAILSATGVLVCYVTSGGFQAYDFLLSCTLMGFIVSIGAIEYGMIKLRRYLHASGIRG